MNKRIVFGLVIQNFDECTGDCVGQIFVPSDQVDWEDQEGKFIDEPLKAGFFPMDMIQPDITHRCALLTKPNQKDS